MFLNLFQPIREPVLVGGAIPPAPAMPASTRISARLKCTQFTTLSSPRRPAGRVGAPATSAEEEEDVALDSPADVGGLDSWGAVVALSTPPRHQAAHSDDGADSGPGMAPCTPPSSRLAVRPFGGIRRRSFAARMKNTGGGCSIIQGIAHTILHLFTKGNTTGSPVVCGIQHPCTGLRVCTWWTRVNVAATTII